MKKNAVVSLISITLCALIGLAAYKTVYVVGGWISDMLGGCVAESNEDCGRTNPADQPMK